MTAVPAGQKCPQTGHGQFVITAGRSVDLQAAGRPDSLIPHVGQRWGASSVRSKTVIGKFESIPPSTQVTLPVGVEKDTGRKKNGMLMLARTASTTRLAAGFCP